MASSQRAFSSQHFLSTGGPAYNDLHYERHLRKIQAGGTSKRKTRASNYKVFKSAVMAHKRKLCERIELPDAVKELLQGPKDETNWDKLQKLRETIVLIAQGLRTTTLDTAEERHEMALAVRGGTGADHGTLSGLAHLGFRSAHGSTLGSSRRARSTRCERKSAATPLRIRSPTVPWVSVWTFRCAR